MTDPSKRVPGAGMALGPPGMWLPSKHVPTPRPEDAGRREATCKGCGWTFNFWLPGAVAAPARCPLCEARVKK